MANFTLSGINQLGKLCCDLSEKIYQHRNRIDALLQQNEELQGLGSLVENNKLSATISFDESDRLYNENISLAEKQAWVWWKQSIGIPMTGWEKYFLHASKGTISELVYTTVATTILANNFKPLSEVAANQLVGKFLRYSESHGELGAYVLCRNQEGIVIVKKSDCRIQKSDIAIDNQKLIKLIKAKALLYCEGELMPYAVYAWGNMYDRQISLAKDSETIIENFGQEVYDFHYSICSESKSPTNQYGALPVKKSIMNDDIHARPFISPISSFATDENEFSINEVRDEYLNIERSDETTMVNGRVEQKKKKERIDLLFDGEKRYSLQLVFIKWLFSLNETEFNEVNAPIIIDYYLEQKVLRNDKKSPDEKKILKAYARNEGDALFQKFLHEVLTYETQSKLDYTWNRLYNGQPLIRYDKIPIAFEISRFFKTGILQLNPMQREVVGFLELSGNGIVSLDVGGGKTICMIVSMAIGLQQGKFSRPLLVIPKQVYPQFLKEMFGYTDKKSNEFNYGVLSGTNIKLNEWYNLGHTKIDKLENEFTKKVQHKTITAITKEGIKKLGFSEKTIATFLEDLLLIFEKKEKEKSARDDEKGVQKILEMIGVSQKGSIADFDILGFDAIYADEAHAYKNIFSGVPPDEDDDKKRYDLTGAVSDFGIRFFFLANFIQRKYGRNIVLATATPFQKAILEIYSMLSLVSFNVMKRNNILNLKRFCDMFIKREMEYVATLKDTLELKEVIKSFVNVDVLRNLIQSAIYYRSKENFTKIVLPCKINLPLINIKENGFVKRLTPDKQIVTYLKMSNLQRENQNRIINNIRLGYLSLNFAEKKAAIFKGIANSQKNTFTPFEYAGEYETYIDFVEQSPKIYAACLAVKSVKDYCKSISKPMTGQIIYSDRGIKYFNMIKEYLDKQIGFQKRIKYDKTTVDEVEIIYSNTTDNYKETIQKAFNDGVCKVIIGTSTIEEGLNLQQYATDIHVINSEWNPTSFVQLAGRIHRQGNPFGYIRFTIYLLQDSIDVPMFQKNEEKIQRINELLQQDNQKVIDADTIDANEIKYSLITDINLIVKMDFDKEKGEAEKAIKKLNYNYILISKIEGDVKEYNNRKKQVLNALQTFKIDDRFINKRSDLQMLERRLLNHYISKDEYTKQKNNEERAIEIENLILTSTELSDKDLITLCKKIINYQRANNFNVRNFSFNPRTRTHEVSAGYDEKTEIPFYAKFSEYVSKIAKTEKTLLRTKGYDRNSDFAIILAEMQKENENAYSQYVALYGEPSKYESDKEYYKKTVAYYNIYQKVNAIKNVYAVSGKTAPEVAKDFAKLNHILKYTIDNRPCGDECCIPDENGQPRTTTKKIPALLLKELELISTNLGTIKPELFKKAQQNAKKKELTFEKFKQGLKQVGDYVYYEGIELFFNITPSAMSRTSAKHMWLTKKACKDSFERNAKEYYPIVKLLLKELELIEKQPEKSYPKEEKKTKNAYELTFKEFLNICPKYPKKNDKIIAVNGDIIEFTGKIKKGGITYAYEIKKNNKIIGFYSKNGIDNFIFDIEDEEISTLLPYSKHKELLKKAISEGKIIPKNVLNEYQDTIDLQNQIANDIKPDQNKLNEHINKIMTNANHEIQ